MLRAFFLWGLLVATACAEELRLIQFSDLHAGGPHYSQSAFQEACSLGLALQPQAVVLTGDHGDNSYDREHFNQRLRRDLPLWKEALKNYPGEVFLALGNDDFGHNYQSEPDDLRATAQTMQQTFGSRCYLNELGNGLSPSQLGGFRWITINSQLFSPMNRTPQAADQAETSLQWLQATLKQGEGPVVLLSHIPPSWDLYLGKPGWHPEYLLRLAEILEEYPSQVIFLCGHLHRNHVQAMRPQRPIPILTCGALATKYGYQPNWRDYLWQVEPGQGLTHLQYRLHYPAHPEWTACYDLCPDRIQDFLDRLIGQWSFCRDYVRDIYGHHNQWENWADKESIREQVFREFWVDPKAVSPRSPD